MQQLLPIEDEVKLLLLMHVYRSAMLGHHAMAAWSASSGTAFRVTQLFEMH